MSQRQTKSRFAPVRLCYLGVLTFVACSAHAQTPASLPATAPPNTPSIPLRDYQTLIGNYARLATSQTPINAQKARIYTDYFSALRRVRLPNGETITVNNQTEIDTLAPYLGTKPGTPPKPLPRAAQKRAALLQEWVNAKPKAALKSDPKKIANRILSTKDFAEAAQKKVDNSLWDKIRQGARWFAEKIGDFLRWIFGNASPGTEREIPGLAKVIAYTLYFLLAVAALVGIYYVARYVVREAPKFRQKRASRLSDLDLTGADIADPMQAAHRAAQSGDYRTAVRLGYIACLRRLAGSGLVVLQENRTNWEYQRALRSRSQSAYNALLPATRLFDRVWYGNRGASPEAFEEILQAHDRLPEAAVQQERAKSSANEVATSDHDKGANPW